MDLYAENILDHYRSPRGQEPMAKATIEHREENASCGDVLTVSLRIQEGALSGLSWSGNGCAISQAAMSMLSEELGGMTVERLHALDPAFVYALLGVPVGVRRAKCALLGLLAIQNAVRIHEKKPPLPWHDLLKDSNGAVQGN